MNKQQFDLVVRHFIQKDNRKVAGNMIDAAEAVLLHGYTSYRAEIDHGCTRGTVARMANKIQARFDECVEVASHGHCAK